MTKTCSFSLRLVAYAPSQLPFDRSRSPHPALVRGTIPLAISKPTADGLRRAAHASRGSLPHALHAAYAWWLHCYADSTHIAFGSESERDASAPGGPGTEPLLQRCVVVGDESFIELVGRIREQVCEPHGHAASTDSGISIELEERPGGQLVGGLVFDADVFDDATAREMASHWCRLLDAVAAAPTVPMADHDLVTPEERRRQLNWNRTTAEAMSSRRVDQLIGSQIERTPDAVAVTAGPASLTYRQLDERAAAIAAHLIQAGAGRGTVVALLLHRTPDVVAAVLGVLRSGAAFLPLDPRQPIARNIFSIKDVGVQIVLTDHEIPGGAESMTADILDIGDLGSGPADRDPRPEPAPASAADLAYVICTSGSTGRPKPVLVEHRGVTNLTHNLISEFGIEAGDTVLSVASIGFDMALFDIFSALSCGARVVLITPEEAVNPGSMGRLMAPAGATYLFATPTIWAALISAGWPGDRRLRAAAGGEALTDALADSLIRRCGAVWNGYGPTEATAGTSMARLVAGDLVTIGRPLANVRVYITDARGRLQPVGVPGEITIGGIGVGRGYLNRPGDTASRFGDDPFLPGGRIYRTGDRGRFLPDGRLQHLGRYDGQLKIRGCRIEPGEIESILCEHPAVGACAIVAREFASGDTQLVAYLVGEPERFSSTEARSWLRRRLPEYMIPSAFVHVHALPMTANGKLDKAALLALSVPALSRVDAQPPTTDTERRVAALWADLLGRPVNDVHSDFFELGGHSLLAARLISEVEQTFGVSLSLESFIDSGRIVAKLAELLSGETAVATTKVTHDSPLHFIFSDAMSAMSARHFTSAWGPARPVHVLIPDQPGGKFDRSVTIEKHARQLLATIRTRQPVGPLALAGYSIGGLVAYEVARQAVAAGQEIEWLGIVDAIAPPLKRAQLKPRWRLHALCRQPPREQMTRLTTFALRMLRRRLHWKTPGFDYKGVTKVGCRYYQPGHRVPVDLFVSEVSAAIAENDTLGWHEFHAGTVIAHRIAGDHISVLRLPGAEPLAARMLESLSAAGNAGSGGGHA